MPDSPEGVVIHRCLPKALCAGSGTWQVPLLVLSAFWGDLLFLFNLHFISMFPFHSCSLGQVGHRRRYPPSRSASVRVRRLSPQSAEVEASALTQLAAPATALRTLECSPSRGDVRRSRLSALVELTALESDRFLAQVCMHCWLTCAVLSEPCPPLGHVAFFPDEPL